MTTSKEIRLGKEGEASWHILCGKCYVVNSLLHFTVALCPGS